MNAAVLEGRAELEQRLATIGTMERRYGCLWSLLIENVMSVDYGLSAPCDDILSPWIDKVMTDNGDDGFDLDRPKFVEAFLDTRR